jgi:hypothetical protein
MTTGNRLKQGLAGFKDMLLTDKVSQLNRAHPVG